MIKFRNILGRGVHTIRRFATRRSIAIAYAIAAVVVLAGTVVVWSLLGANIQLGNADQLVNTYLFDNGATIHGAELAGQHTFLLKWPLFWAIDHFGASATDFAVATVAVTLSTVAVLVAVLWRIERRPLVFGTLCLALASVLLLVPAEPYPGGLLPVNMAMVATRNLEYVLYIAGLALLIRYPSFKKWQYWVAVVLMGVLVASDKLFLTLSVGGAVLSLSVYALTRRWSLVSLSVKWLVAGVGAAASAAAILWAVRISAFTHIASEANLSPYGIVHTTKNVVLGSVYAMLSLLSNFGANPAADTRLLRNVPHQAALNLFSLSGVGYVVNGVLFMLCVYAVYRLLRASLWGKDKHLHSDRPNRLSIMLIWSTVTAIAVFIVTNHYYPVDARYVSLCFFALFIAAATFGRTIRWRPKRLAVCALVLAVAIASGLVGAVRTYHQEKAALSTTEKRNVRVAQALRGHHVKVLVGDYWRVIPTKVGASKKLHVMPMSDCTTPRDILSSSVWQPGLNNHSFAYLLTLDPSLTGYPPCTIDQVVSQYGRPNASVPIAGKVSQPEELLLFYDKGAHRSSPLTPQSTTAPITPEQLPYTTCSVPTVMNIVAHQDDDLLFINPDLVHDIKAGKCIRTIYVTAGDAGSGSFYWLGREKGSEAAYSAIIGTKTIWVERTVKLSDHAFATVANPRGNPAVTLIFMHLPDGNLHGEGFNAYGRQSLASLEAGTLGTINAVDGQSEYTSDQLVTALTSLMHIYQPAEIRTQASVTSSEVPDHSDHMVVGRYAARAHEQYQYEQYQNEVTIPLKYYIGYPGRAMSPNVSGSDLEDKEKMFFAYARYDNGACRSMLLCRSTNYRFYLMQQYQADE